MDGKNWKWWHFVACGLLIGAFGAYELYSGRISKGIGSEVLATLCVVFGLFSRKSDAKSTQDSSK